MSSSAKGDVDHLVLTEGGEGIGEMEVNEWSELLTNEQNIAVAHHVQPTIYHANSNHHKRGNGKFKRCDPLTSPWQNKNNHQIIETKPAVPQRINGYYAADNNGYRNSSPVRPPQWSLPPPTLPAKSLKPASNGYINGHMKNLNNIGGRL